MLLLFLLLVFQVTLINAKPNIVFLVCESTDGRTWQRGYQNNTVPLPTLRKLEELGGTSFHRHYSNTPVCCPSRATFWSGRHAHHIPHVHNGIQVNGVWNNYEGLPSNFSNRIDQVLQRNGYDTKIFGKQDWTAGAHTVNVRLNAWTMYTQFPYNQTKNGGWRDETPDCRSNGTVTSGNKSAHPKDWDQVSQGTDWLIQHHSDTSTPFFIYQGMNIVHPPYVTNEKYYNKIDPKRVSVPVWPSLDSLHPCDLQSSMLKGCIPSTEESANFYSIARRRRIRRIYYAMISEFDAMVGTYVDTVRNMGKMNNTIFIITSDHGDQQMEHQQFYKMVPYEASASVPMIIYDGRKIQDPNQSISFNVVDLPTQLIDIFPTIMEYAGVTDLPPGLDGHSLVSLVTPPASASSTERPNFIVSQFHGDNIAMSWYLIVQPLQCLGDQSCMMKYVVYGTGKEVVSQLFDLSNDPDETKNLIHAEDYSNMVETLDSNLRTVVDYPKVSLNVAQYNKDSMLGWMNATKHWKDQIHAPDLRWTKSWNENANDSSLTALEKWISQPTKVVGCRSTMTFPSLKNEEL